MANYSSSAPALDAVFRALADPTRRAVLHRLGEGPASVGQLAEPFEMALPSFLQHVRVLEGCGLVKSRKQGRVRICALAGDTLHDAAAWIRDQEDALGDHLDRLAAFVEGEEEGMRKEDLARVTGFGALRQVEARRIVQAPIERVWAALTDAELVARWWAPGDIDAREGGRIRLAEEGADCGDETGLDGVIKVCVPPRLLVFTWNEDYTESGLVRFDLIEVGEGLTQVTLTQNVPASDVLGAAAGWHELLERFERVAKGEDPGAPGRRFEELQEVYREALAAQPA